MFPGLNLPEEHLIEYFSHSPFYDRTSANERFAKLVNPKEIDEFMAISAGKQYLKEHARPPRLYCILRQVRHNESSVTPTGMFYIIDGNIYEAPTLRAVAENRLMTSIFHLQNSFKIFSTFTEWDPIKDYSWDRKKSEDVEKKDDLERLKWEGRADISHMHYLISEWDKKIAPKKRPREPVAPATPVSPAPPTTAASPMQPPAKKQKV